MKALLYCRVKQRNLEFLKAREETRLVIEVNHLKCESKWNKPRMTNILSKKCKIFYHSLKAKEVNLHTAVLTLQSINIPSFYLPNVDDEQI